MHHQSASIDYKEVSAFQLDAKSVMLLLRYCNLLRKKKGIEIQLVDKNPLEKVYLFGTQAKDLELQNIFLI